MNNLDIKEHIRIMAVEALETINIYFNEEWP